MLCLYLTFIFEHRSFTTSVQRNNNKSRVQSPTRREPVCARGRASATQSQNIMAVPGGRWTI